MRFQHTPIALAAFALCASLPFAAQAAPSGLAFKKPTGGQTISGNIYQSSACEVIGSNIDRVKFYLDATALNTEESAPWNCNLDTRKFANGTHTLKAVAYDTGGASASTQISVNIQNGTTTPPPPSTNTPPAVSFKAPLNGATVKAWLDGPTCEALATDSDGVTQVQFFLDSTALNTEKLAPWNCSFDTSKFANGTHTLKAVATDAKGAAGTGQISINIQNGTTTPPPAPANTPPAVSFKAPLNGATVKGWLDGVTCEALASDSDGVTQVQFFLDSTALNTEKLAPFNCSFDTSKFSNGTHALKAVATDAKGAAGTGQISINIQNGSTTPPANTPPAVSITAPAAGATLTGTGATVAATASDTDGSVAKVDFYVGSTLAVTKTAAPYQGTIDTTKFANGTYSLMAVATDNLGATASTQRSVSISNTVTPPSDTPLLPSTGTKAVSTFESLGLYWKPGSNPGAAGCEVRYRKQGDTEWKQGLAMWYDTRDSECRGSLVHLTPDTNYEVQFAMPGQQPVAQVNAKTWSENFPIAQTVYVSSGSQTLNITQGGTASGYVLYTPAPGSSATLDAGNAADYNIKISAPYVIIRGLTLKGAKIDGIRMVAGAHDVVIEDNDISGWGRYRTTLSNGWQAGVDRDAAVRADCRADAFVLERTVVQRNRIHDPRYTANSWDFGHPYGPQGVTYSYCGGNHVFRHNEVYSSDGTKYLNDAFSGEDNFSANGFPHSDSDIYGNKISHTWDDGIEAEGLNRNVRIWGNYLDNTSVGIATTVTHAGPVYIFRNVYNRSRKMALQSTDTGDRLTFAKSGTTSSYGDGRRYVFHNTLLQATQAGSTYPLGAGGGLSAGGSTQPLTNTVSRNNILHVWKSGWNSINSSGGSGNDLDYDLRNGGISAYAGAEPNGIVGTPIYAPGHGWQSESNGLYQLAPTSPGYDRGARLPNFNDGYTGAAPDIGAHEAGTPAMKFGLNGASATWPSGSAPVATDTGGTTTTTTTSDATSGTGTTTTGSTTTTSGGTVCSTALCVITQ